MGRPGFFRLLVMFATLTLLIFSAACEVKPDPPPTDDATADVASPQDASKASDAPSDVTPVESDAAPDAGVAAPDGGE